MSVLIVEDHADWREIMRNHLLSLGLQVRAVGTLREMKEALQQSLPEVLILDASLPDGDLLLELPLLRKNFPSVGIVVVTARVRSEEKIKGLFDGADHFLTKPLSLSVLTATLATLSRRMALSPRSNVKDDNAWRFDPKSGRFSGPDAVLLTFTDRESTVLSILMANPLFPQSPAKLLQALGYPDDQYDTHRLDTIVYRIRQKLRTLSNSPILIRNIYGEGYLCISADPTVDVTVAEEN